MGPVWAERTDFQPVCDLAWAPHHPTLRVRPRVSLLATTLPGWVTAFGRGGRWRVNADIWCLTVWSWANVEQVDASADPGRHHFPVTANLQVGHPSPAGVRVRALDHRNASYVTLLQNRGVTISICYLQYRYLPKIMINISINEINIVPEKQSISRSRSKEVFLVPIFSKI